MSGGFVQDNSNLTDEECQSLAAAHAKVLHSLGGRIRRLFELATGQPIAAGQPRSVGHNPQGLYGVDFSGPPWGSAWRHPLGGTGGLLPITGGAGHWEGHRVLGSVTEEDNLIIPFNLYVRGFEKRPDSPYSRGYLTMRMYLGTADPPYDITAILRSKGGSDVGAMETTVSVGSVFETEEQPTDAYFDLRPGLNRLELELRSTEPLPVYLASFSVNNIVKRVHP